MRYRCTLVYEDQMGDRSDSNAYQPTLDNTALVFPKYSCGLWYPIFVFVLSMPWFQTTEKREPTTTTIRHNYYNNENPTQNPTKIMHTCVNKTKQTSNQTLALKPYPQSPSTHKYPKALKNLKIHKNTQKQQNPHRKILNHVKYCLPLFWHVTFLGAACNGDSKYGVAKVYFGLYSDYKCHYAY